MRHNLGTAAVSRFRNPAPPAAPVVRRRYHGETVTVYTWHCAGYQHAPPVFRLRPKASRR